MFKSFRKVYIKGFYWNEAVLTLFSCSHSICGIKRCWTWLTAGGGNIHIHTRSREWRNEEKRTRKYHANKCKVNEPRWSTQAPVFFFQFTMLKRTSRCYVIFVRKLGLEKSLEFEWIVDSDGDYYGENVSCCLCPCGTNYWHEKEEFAVKNDENK